MKPVVVFSNPGDIHYRAFARTAELRGQPAPELVDLGAFPGEVAATVRLAPAASLRIGDVVIAAETSVWWRRPSPYGVAASIGRPATRRFVMRESNQTIVGGLSAVGPFVVNDPLRDEAATYKLTQLRAAAECGLQIPETVVTSSVDEVAALAQDGKRRVYKAFTSADNRFAPTQELTARTPQELANVALSPVIVQELVPAQVDLRVTVVGRRVFPVAIRSTELDWRVDREPDYERYELDDSVTAATLELMDRLGLEYGALDFRLTEGGPVFLECNPGGQYLFCEIATDSPITDALVDLLYDPATHARLER